MTKSDVKKNVLMLSTSYPVVVGSVSGLFVSQLATALTDKLNVLVLAPDADSGNVLSPASVELNVFRYAPRARQVLAHVPGGIPSQLKVNKFNYLLLPVFIVSYVFSSLKRAKSVDVVHANWAFSAVAGWLVKKVFDVPLVTTLRGADVGSSGGVSGALLRFSLWASDSVVVVSDEMLLQLKQQYPKYSKKYVAIHNGVSDLFSPKNKNPDFFLKKRLKLVCVGSLIARKNLGYVIDALSFIGEQGIDFELNLIGDGAGRKALVETVARLGLEEHVCFLGELPPEQVADQVNHAHVYISSSLHEGRPNGVLEAMAAGCCCVLSDISGHRELAGEERGIIYSLDSSDALVKVLCSLDAQRDVIAVMGQKSRRYIEANSLTWSTCAAAYGALFDEIISRRKN